MASKTAQHLSSRLIFPLLLSLIVTGIGTYILMDRQLSRITTEMPTSYPLLQGVAALYLLLILFIYLLLYVFLQRPLKTISNELRNKGKISTRTGTVEIDRLVDTVNSALSDRTQAQSSLTMAVKNIQTIFESVPVGVMIVNRNKEVLHINQRALDILQREAADVLGQTCHQHICPTEQGQCPVWDLHKETDNAERTLLDREGNEIPIHKTTTRITLDDEEVLLEAFLDLRQIKKAEQQQHQLELQLYQSQKMESIGRLAGGVAHDFNNILSAINGYAEMSLMKMTDDAPFKKEMGIILESGQRATRLTQQLLAFSRKQIIKQERVDLNGEVDTIRKMLGRLLGEDIEIEISQHKGLWPVMADRSQVEQVLLNLAVNARDTMKNGGRLTIETANVSLDEESARNHYEIDPGDYAMLAVSDTGHGMSPEVQEHIFEPFFTTKGHDQGTGLGLATVYGIVKQNNGEVLVYSEEGTGTTFKVYLPRAGEKDDELKNHEGAEADDACGGTETIMLVEDEEMVRKLCVEILAKLGYVVLEAENGEDALRTCNRYHGSIDLLLTDVVMPKMNGTELAGKLEEISPKTKVLYMSGYTENAIVRQGILKEDIHFIHKPISPKTLAQTIRRILDE